MVTRLLDAADKVPSFCLEQEPTPGGSSLRGLRAAGPAVREPTSPAPPATAHPTQARAGQSGLTGCQALAGKAAPRRPPHSRISRPPGLGRQSRPIPRPRSGLQGPYLGNHLACSVQGSSPCSQLCRPPRQKKHLTWSCRPGWSMDAGPAHTRPLGAARSPLTHPLGPVCPPGLGSWGLPGGLSSHGRGSLGSPLSPRGAPPALCHPPCLAFPLDFTCTPLSQGRNGGRAGVCSQQGRWTVRPGALSIL